MSNIAHIINFGKNAKSTAKPPLRSVSYGKLCLSKCYPAKETHIHPITLVQLDGKIDSCAVYPYAIENEMNPNDMGVLAPCNLDDNLTHSLPDDIQMFLLDLTFDPKEFLEIYELGTFNQVIAWTLENDHLLFDTIKRVHECAWRAFGKDLENISTSVYEYYYDMAKNRWMLDYIEALETNYSFEIESSNSNTHPKMDTLKEVIQNKYFSYYFFVESIQQYISINKHMWDNIFFHYGPIKNYIYDCIVKKLRQEYPNLTIKEETEYKEKTNPRLDKKQKVKK